MQTSTQNPVATFDKSIHGLRIGYLALLPPDEDVLHSIGVRRALLRLV